MADLTPAQQAALSAAGAPPAPEASARPMVTTNTGSMDAEERGMFEEANPDAVQSGSPDQFTGPAPAAPAAPAATPTVSPSAAGTNTSTLVTPATSSSSTSPAAPASTPDAPVRTGVPGAINSITPRSGLETPRLRVFVGGELCLGFDEASVTSVGHLSADKFTATCAMGADPKKDEVWWSNQQDVRVDIRFALLEPGQTEDQATFRSLIIGVVDRINYNPFTNLIVIDGKDLSSLLMESPIVDSYRNESPSSLARRFASDVGLDSDVDEVGGFAGQFYQLQHTAQSTGEFGRATNKWDLLAFMAQQTGYRLYVEGTKLYFKAPIEPDKDHPYVINVTKGERTQTGSVSASATASVINAIAVSCDRHTHLARDIQVVVQSHHGHLGASFQAVASKSGVHVTGQGGATRRTAPTDEFGPAIGGGGGGGDEFGGAAHVPSPHNEHTPGKVSGRVSRYLFIRRNMTREDAVAFAKKMLTEISSHERLVDIRIPGEIKIGPQVMVKLTGTGTSWDQPYYVDTVHRRLSENSGIGFVQDMHVRNTSPGAQITEG